MKKSSKKLFWVLMGLMMMLLLAACGGEDAKNDNASNTEKNASDNAGKRKVVIGGLYDITGATGDVGTPYTEGEKAYFEYLASKGGAEGLDIQLIGKDYAYSIPEAQKIYQELRDKEGAVAILGWGTGDTEALRKQVATDELPYFSASYSESLKNLKESPYNFLVAASYSDQGRAVLSWIKENHKGGNPTVALLYNDTAFGRSPVEDMKAYAKEIGVEVVDEQVIDVKATEAQSQLLNMKKKNPDYAIIQQTWGAASTILRDAKTLGIDTQFIGLNWAAGEGLIKTAGADVAEGYMGVITHAFPTEEFEGVKDIKDYLDAKGMKIEDIDQKFVQGWSTAKIMAAGIQAAASKYPEGELTGAQIREGIESLQDVDLGGLGSNVTFSADSHAGTEMVRLGVVKDGKWEATTDYFSYKK